MASRAKGGACPLELPAPWQPLSRRPTMSKSANFATITEQRSVGSTRCHRGQARSSRIALAGAILAATALRHAGAARIAPASAMRDERACPLWQRVEPTDRCSVIVAKLADLLIVGRRESGCHGAGSSRGHAPPFARDAIY